jgi:hypothetical protein
MLNCQTLILAIVILISGACAPRTPSNPQVFQNEPPSSCEIQQPVWCLLYSDATYSDLPSASEAFASEWVVRGNTWKDYPLVIHEPRGCRVGRSDTVELVDYVKDFEWGGRKMNKVVVRMKSDNTCNLEFISFHLKDDPQAGGFFAAMTLVRPCTEQTCEGDAIGAKIGHLLSPS